MISFPRAIIPNPHRSMDPYDVQFCITNALRFLSGTRLVGVFALSFSSRHIQSFYACILLAFCGYLDLSFVSFHCNDADACLQR